MLATDQAVVRIGRSADRLPRVGRELCVARWLAAANIAAVRVIEDMEQPLLVGGYPVSFWQSVTGGDPVPGGCGADLAAQGGPGRLTPATAGRLLGLGAGGSARGGAILRCGTARMGREAQAEPEVGWQAEAPDEIEMELQ